MNITTKISDWYRKHKNLILIPIGDYRTFVPIVNINLEQYDLPIFDPLNYIDEKGYAFYRFNNDKHDWDFITFQKSDMPILTVRSIKEAKVYGDIPEHELRAIKCILRYKFSRTKRKPYEIIW